MCPFPRNKPKRGAVGGSGIVVILAVLLFPLAARAVPTIVLGSYNLQPNQANQVINIYVSGGDSVQGCNFALTTGDGGTAAGGSVDAPAITSISLTANTSVFGSNNTGTQDHVGGTLPQFDLATTTTSSGMVNLSGTQTDPVTGIGPQGLLAVVTLDTTGFFSGSYNISVAGRDIRDGDVGVLTETTTFPPESDTAPTLYADGVINIVPAPASLGLLVLAIPVLLLRRGYGAERLRRPER